MMCMEVEHLVFEGTRVVSMKVDKQEGGLLVEQEEAEGKKEEGEEEEDLKKVCKVEHREVEAYY